VLADALGSFPAANYPEDKNPDFMRLAPTSLQSDLTRYSKQLILFDIEPDSI